MVEPLRINRQRVHSDIAALSSIGRAQDNHAIDRAVFSDAEMHAREWLKRRIEAAGLEYAVDGAANVVAALAGTTEGGAVITGSHLDTSAQAGPREGALGVIAGLECLRRLRELGITPERSVECIAFTDGARAHGICIGAEALTGSLNTHVVGVLYNRAGEAFADRFRQRGFEPLQLVSARRDAAGIGAFVELVGAVQAFETTDAAPIGVVAIGDDDGADRIRCRVCAAASAFGVDAVLLPDTAAREAWVLSRLAPAGTIVLQTHDRGWPLTEHDWDDVELAANVLLNTIYRLARG